MKDSQMKWNSDNLRTIQTMKRIKQEGTKDSQIELEKQISEIISRNISTPSRSPKDVDFILQRIKPGIIKELSTLLNTEREGSKKEITILTNLSQVLGSLKVIVKDQWSEYDETVKKDLSQLLIDKYDSLPKSEKGDK